MPRPLTTVLLAFALAFATLLPCRAEPEVWAFFRSDVPLYLAIVQQLEARLKRQFVSCPVEKTTSSFIDSRSPSIVIAFGEAGLKRALTMTWNVPILSVFDGDEGHDSRVVPIEISQPHHLQVRTLKKLNPGLKTIWYPYAGEDFKPAPTLEKAAQEDGVKLVVNRLQDPRSLPEALRALDASTVATILPPDPGLMNDAVTRPIMLAAFRSQSVIVGFSEGLVKKGAGFAYVLTPERLAAWLDDVVTKYDHRSPVRKFENWSLILNATILDKLRLSLPADVRNAADKVF